MRMPHPAALLMFAFTSVALSGQPPVVSYPVTYPLDYKGHYLTQREADEIVRVTKGIRDIDHRVLMINVDSPRDVEANTGPRLGNPHGNTLRLQRRDGQWLLIKKSKGSGF